MAFEDNIFNSPLDQGEPLWAGEVDYTAYPVSVMDTGGSGVGDWLKQSLSKTLDYFIVKDIAETKAQFQTQATQPGYYRGADGQVYRAGSAVPVAGQTGQGGRNDLMLILLIGGAVLLLGRK